MDFSQYLAAIEHIPLDWVIFGVIATLLAFETYRAGSSHAASLATAFPLAFILLMWMPKTMPMTSIPFLGDPRVIAAAFSIIVFLLTMLIGRVFFTFSSGSGGLLQAAICGVGSAVILAVCWISSPDLSYVYAFGPQMSLVFGEAYRFWWVIAGFFALAFARD